MAERHQLFHTPLEVENCPLRTPLVLYYSLNSWPQMTSSFAPIDAIDATFNRSSGTTSILFLIEDSSYMVPLWQRLARSYIPRFLTAIKDANPHASVSPPTPFLPLLPIMILQMEALWMITSQETPFKPPFDPPTCQTPRCDNIPLINFSAHGENPVSPTNVTYAIEVHKLHFNRFCSDMILSLGVVGDLWP